MTEHLEHHGTPCRLPNFHHQFVRCDCGEDVFALVNCCQCNVEGCENCMKQNETLEYICENCEE